MKKQLILFFILFSSLVYSQEFLKTPLSLAKPCKMDYLEQINNGGISLTDIVKETNGIDWTVIVDREKPPIYVSADHRSRIDDRKSVKFKQSLKVSKVKETRLYVHNIKTKEALGWIEAKHLLLSSFSLMTDQMFSLPRKAIVVSSMEGLTPDNKEKIYKQRKYYNGPSTNTHISIDEAKQFQILFVFKDQDGAFLLGTVDHLTGSGIDNKAKILGWLMNANKTEWNSRVCLEPLANTDNPHKNKKYPGFGKKSDEKKDYPAFNRLKNLVEEEANIHDSTDVFIEVYPGKIHKNRMRYPILDESEHNTSNYKKVVSIVKGQTSGREIWKNTIEILKEKSKQTNIIFAIDGTISMERYRESVARTINKIVKNNQDLNQHNLKIGFIVYRDYPDGEGPCETCSYYYEPLTTNYEYISEKIANIKCYSKDSDPAEAQYNGLIKGINALDLNPNNSNIVVLIGDCGNHSKSDDKNNYTLEDVAQLFSEKEINLISFQVSMFDDYAYYTFNSEVQDIINYTSKAVVKDKNSTLKPDLKPDNTNNTYKLVWEGQNSDCDFQNMFGRFIYASPNEEMRASDLESLIVNSLSEYMETVDRKILIIEEYISGHKGCTQVDTEKPAEGVIVWFMEKLKMSRKEAIAFLVQNEVTVKAFIAKNYLEGGKISNNMNEDLLRYVVFLTDQEFMNLKEILNALISDNSCSGGKGKQVCFETTMKEIVRKIIGDGFESKEMNDMINNMTMNDVWLHLFQVEFKNEDLKNIKLNRLASDIKPRKFKDFYEDFKITAKRFIKKSYSHKNDYTSRKFKLNRDTFYWIPIEDIPGAY